MPFFPPYTDQTNPYSVSTQPRQPACLTVTLQRTWDGKKFLQQGTYCTQIILANMVSNEEREVLVDTEQKPEACRTSIDQAISLQKYCAKKLNGTSKARWQRVACDQTLEGESIVPLGMAHAKNILEQISKGVRSPSAETD